MTPSFPSRQTPRLRQSSLVNITLGKSSNIRTCNYNHRMAKHGREANESFVGNTNETDLTMVLDPTDDETESAPPAHDPVGGLADVPEYALVVYKGQQSGRTWLLSPGVNRVGRHPYSDIALDHITVSRRHCRIRLDATGLSLEDLGSTNGSYVNDSLVEEMSLCAGDRLMIGTFHLLVARGR